MTKYLVAIGLAFTIVTMPVKAADTEVETTQPSRHGLGLLMDTDKSPVSDVIDQSATVT